MSYKIRLWFCQCFKNRTGNWTNKDTDSRFNGPMIIQSIELNSQWNSPQSHNGILRKEYGNY